MRIAFPITPITQVIIACAYLLVCGPTYAQPASNVLGPQESSEKLVAPLKLNQPAPYAGLLVPELKFMQLLEAELKVGELEGQLDIENRLLVGLEEIYLKRLEQATKSPKWYETNTFYWWFGFTVGVALAGTAVYLAVEVVEATR